MLFNLSELKAWTICGVALFSFAAGSLMITLAKSTAAKADGNRVFELRVYRVMPGKLPVMVSRFRATTSKLLAKHNLNVLGYWTAEETPNVGATFIFLLAHGSQEEARDNWEAMRADPEFQAVVKAEQTEKTLEKAEVTFMRATDFSPLK